MPALGLDGMVVIAALLGLVGVLAVAWAVRSLSGGREDVLRRLRPRSGPDHDAAPPRRGALAGALAQRLRPVVRLAQPTGEEGSRFTLQLHRAGLRSAHSAQAFVATKMGLALAFLIGFFWAQAARADPVPLGPALAVLAAAIGFYAPNLWLSSRVSGRQRAIERGLPDALDLLVTCVEAGLGLDAALVRVADEIRPAFPTLSDELQLTFLEVKAGLARVEAFRRLADRTGLDELKQLSATLTQTEMFGTSIGAALRIQAGGIRVRRMQRAEERAGMVAVKMTLPLVLCILPSLFAVIIGPAVVNISQTFMRM